jgi:hypothetical protein
MGTPSPDLIARRKQLNRQVALQCAVLRISKDASDHALKYTVDAYLEFIETGE